jgi:hypothetical protein
MIPINMDNTRLDHLAATLNCKKGSLPFTYLGLPLGITKPSPEHFLPMVQRVQHKLCGIADFLNYGGKIEMVKSVLSSLPMFYMDFLDIPVTIKDQVIKYMRHCLWRGKGITMYKHKVKLWLHGAKFEDQRSKEVLVF